MGVTATRTKERADARIAGSDAVTRLRPDGPADVAGTARLERPSRWRRFAGSARNRMLVVFLSLMLCAGLASIVGIRAVLTLRVDERVHDALEQEVEELEVLLSNGRDPRTGEPFASLTSALDVYFERNVPSVEEAHVAFVDGELYRQRLRSFPLRDLPADALGEWRRFSVDGGDALDGTFGTDVGTVRFRAVRVEVGGESGAFVVAILPLAELREIRDLQSYGVLVVLGVVAMAGLCAWWLADRILAPVRELTETARSISEVDRRARVSVVGHSEAAEMAQTFNTMMDRLDDVHYSQLAFLQAVGHELRTPLTVATGHLEVLSTDERDADRRAELSLVIDELGRMGRLVDDLQSLAESAREDYVVARPIVVRDFAHDVLAKASVLGDRQWLIDELGGERLVADEERLAQAVLNLMDNAVKHTAPGDTIALGVVVDDHEARLWVRDTGRGIDPGERERIFERFVRGRDAPRRYRGSGLGLAIVRSIAEAHGGSADADVRAGVGARFEIRFPQGDVR